MRCKKPSTTAQTGEIMLYNILDADSAKQTLNEVFQQTNSTEIGYKPWPSDGQYLGSDMLKFRCRHITTCDDGGNSFRKLGILTPIDVLANQDIPLASFIEQHTGIRYKDHHFYHGKNKLSQVCVSSIKLEDGGDNRVNAFLNGGGKLGEYDGYDQRPEIIFNCAADAGMHLSEILNIEKRWQKRHKPYAITFDVSFIKVYSIAGYYAGDEFEEDEIDFFTIMQRLMELALKVSSGKSVDKIPITLVENYTVPPDDIVSITPLSE